MPREGSLTLSDIREPTLAIACERCGRHGRYNVARLIAAQGADAKLTDLLVTLANCRSASTTAAKRSSRTSASDDPSPGKGAFDLIRTICRKVRAPI